MTTTDAELRAHADGSWLFAPFVDKDKAERWLSDRAVLRALVEALPRCTRVRCCSPSTMVATSGAGFCDEHAVGHGHMLEKQHAPTLRAALARVSEWDGGGR